MEQRDPAAKNSCETQGGPSDKAASPTERRQANRAGRDGNEATATRRNAVVGRATCKPAAAGTYLRSNIERTWDITRVMVASGTTPSSSYPRHSRSRQRRAST